MSVTYVQRKLCPAHECTQCSTLISAQKQKLPKITPDKNFRSSLWLGEYYTKDIYMGKMLIYPVIVCIQWNKTL